MYLCLLLFVISCMTQDPGYRKIWKKKVSVLITSRPSGFRTSSLGLYLANVWNRSQNMWLTKKLLSHHWLLQKPLTLWLGLWPCDKSGCPLFLLSVGWYSKERKTLKGKKSKHFKITNNNINDKDINRL